jgi:3-oxoacyl-[acyl-carrier-protein] synthase II
MGRRRVVVTGLGMISPLGNSVKHTWEKLIKGKSGIKKIATNNAVKIAATVDFDPSLYFTKSVQL